MLRQGLIVCFLSLAVGTPEGSAADLVGPVGPLEASLLADVADGRLDGRSLLAGALIASGVDQAAQIERIQRRWDEQVGEIRRELASRFDELARAKAALESLHQRVLRGPYGRDHTDLRTALTEGRFNCVSATVLFVCLAEAIGLDVQAVESPGHVTARIRLPGRSLDLETTLEQGTEPEPRPDQREVGRLGLLAMIYYNRGVDLLKQERFAEAIAANALALRLDPGSPRARGNLLAAMNNQAVAAIVARRYAEAADRLRLGLRIDPHYAAFARNFAYLHAPWVDELCRAGRFEEALARVRQAEQVRPQEPYFPQAAVDIVRRQAQSQSDRSGI